MRRFSRHQSRQKLSFDNELSSSNLLKIRGWTSQLVVISGNEDTSGHHLLLLKASNALFSLGLFRIGWMGVDKIEDTEASFLHLPTCVYYFSKAAPQNLADFYAKPRIGKSFRTQSHHHAKTA